jgi:hypothetical protein
MKKKLCTVEATVKKLKSIRISTKEILKNISLKQTASV